MNDDLYNRIKGEDAYKLITQVIRDISRLPPNGALNHQKMNLKHSLNQTAFDYDINLAPMGESIEQLKERNEQSYTSLESKLLRAIKDFKILI